MPASFTHNLKCLILSSTPLIIVETAEEDRLDILLEDLCAEMLWTYFDWSLASGLRNRTTKKTLVEANQLRRSLVRMIDIHIPSVFYFRGLDVHMDDPLVQRQVFELVQGYHKTDTPMAIVISGNLQLPSHIETFTSHLPLELPGVEELERIAVNTVNGLRERFDVDIQIDHQGKDELVKSLRGLTANQARQKLSQVMIDDRALSNEDISNLSQEKASAIRDGGLLEYFPPAANQFSIGGFDRLKKWLDRARMGFSKEAEALNLRPPKGILLVGVQGCGKSLAAKIIARDWALPLLKLDAGRLFDKYIGESEANMRKALQLAESLSPCVLWIDEVEKGFATGGEDGGTGRRMLGSFLSWMQEHRHEVFIVATANDLETLPPEFMRKGRFDELFFVDLPNRLERAEIFTIHLKLRNQNPEDFDIPTLVERSKGFSGAEIEQAVITAAYESLYIKQSLSDELIAKELRNTIPLSVSRKEAVEQLRSHAKGRFLPVSNPVDESMY